LSDLFLWGPLDKQKKEKKNDKGREEGKKKKFE
jgi:hypothetical protein